MPVTLEQIEKQVTELRKLVRETPWLQVVVVDSDTYVVCPVCMNTQAAGLRCREDRVTWFVSCTKPLVHAPGCVFAEETK